ncbi:MAG: flagellar basal body-associated FliL family protein [Emcibacter sp.]|nr:flagellar basal body-associated FliL family protein [Emcibacter sp.]
MSDKNKENKDNNDTDADEEDLAEGLEQKKTSGKKIIIIAAVAVLVLILGGGAAYFFMSSGDNEEGAIATDLEHGGQETDLEKTHKGDPLFVELEPMLVNLDTAGGKPKYLKLTIALEVDEQVSIEDINKKMPRIIDQFQTYLRQLRIDDLNGSAGMFRLKEELLIKVNDAVYPTRVNDVLFKEMLVNG